ncbi:MAG: TetR/AcrR family transcriptional regulator [Epulopiscium sp.]|nr:TetR/AcrR family transcriptional regulator [Candidatus Epulonipiscium sp.]
MNSLKEKRRIQIIKASMKVFGEHGFYKGTVEDIAIQAGLGKGTIYEYFSSKKEIFQQMLSYMFETYSEVAIESTLKEDTIRNKFIALLDYHWDFVTEHANVIEQTFFRFENISQEIRPHVIKVQKRIFEFIFNMVTEGVKRGEISPTINKELVSLIVLSTINGSNSKRIIFKEKDCIDSKAVIDTIFNGIGNQ